MSIIFFGVEWYEISSEAPPRDAGEPLVLHANMGGGVFNAAVGAKRWLHYHAHSELPVYFIGEISEDNFGKKIVRFLEQEGVDATRAHASSASTALAIVLNDETGERSFSFHRHHTSDLDYPVTCWKEEWFEDAHLFACDTNCMTTEEIFTSNIKGLEYALNHHIMTAIDVNLRPVLWESEKDMRTRVRRALSYATLIKFSAEELPLIFGGTHESTQRQQLFALPNHAQKKRILCISRGEQGCTIYFENDEAGAPIVISAPEVQVVDTTGAGDAFFGTLCSFVTLNQLHNDARDHALMRRAATEAVAFATHTVQYQGALRYSVAHK